jgi:hypothetical protein
MEDDVTDMLERLIDYFGTGPQSYSKCSILDEDGNHAWGMVEPDLEDLLQEIRLHLEEESA